MRDGSDGAVEIVVRIEAFLLLVRLARIAVTVVEASDTP